MLGLFLFIAIFVGFVMLTNKNPQIQRMKRDKPYLNLAIILVLSGFVLNLIGSLLIFLFSICLPLSREYFIVLKIVLSKFAKLIHIVFLFAVIFLHAAFRLRNLKNKVTNKIELIGVSRTPMGYLLEQLGATNEAAS